MLSLSYIMADNISSVSIGDIWDEISKLRTYFIKFAGANADEAMQRALMHTLTHFDANKGSLQVYIKRLAREITKDGGRYIYVDFLEDTVSNDTPNQIKVDAGKLEDFSVGVVNRLQDPYPVRDKLEHLALSYLDKFVLLCNSIIKHDTTTTYFPNIFIKTVLKLSDLYRGNFNQECLNLYREYKEDIEWFLELDENNTGVWSEADFLLLKQSVSKRVTLVNSRTGKPVIDADYEDCEVKGTIGASKCILKVPYYDIWDNLCKLVETNETNELRFVMGNNFIVRTLGGSLTTVNPNIGNIYDLIRDEIVTNILHDTGGRLLNISEENVYVLCDKSRIGMKRERVLRGIEVNIDYSNNVA